MTIAIVLLTERCVHQSEANQHVLAGVHFEGVHSEGVHFEGVYAGPMAYLHIKV